MRQSPFGETRLKAKIANISVLQDGVSVRMNVLNGSDTDVQKLSLCKDKTQDFEINALKISAQVKSININNGLTFLLHISKEQRTIHKLIDLMDHEFINFSEASSQAHQDSDVSDLLRQVAQKNNESEEELLCRLTTFTAKDGVVVKGKKSISDMSPKQIIVLKDKLAKVMSVAA